MTRLLQIEAQIAALKAEKKALRPQVFKPGLRSRSFKPEGEGQRVVRDRDPGFLAYLRRQPCEARHMGGCSGPIQAAHIRYSDAAAGSINPGMQRKNHDRHANPLCEGHHLYGQHKTNERAWWASIGKDAYATASAHYAAYQSATPTAARSDDGRL